MPCRSFLAQLREARGEISEAGVGIIGVATGAAFQARDLMSRGIDFPLLVDPERELFEALGLEHIAWHRWFAPSTWIKYVRGARGARQGAFTGDLRQSPGVAIIEPDRTIRYLHRGITLGDYPPLAEVLAAVKGDGA